MDPRNESRPRTDGGCRRPELAARLVEWDSLAVGARAELSAHAAACASCGPKLAHLRRAQAWLEGPAPAASACPPAETLFDFGRGPGARALAEPQRALVAEHVASCADCAALVATLASRPPVPLIDFEGPARVAPVRAVAAPRRRWRSLAWIPLAAAAALALRFLWPHEAASHPLGGSIRFPAAPVLRGASDDTLLFPRDRVLCGSKGLFAAPTFELLPRERATRYDIRIFRHDGGAFDPGRPVATLSAGALPIDAQSIRGELSPGHYTWEAWAIVDGLDVHLGRRDFDVRVDDDLIAQIDARSSAPEPTRSEAILHLLHDAGFVGDARAFARTLPPTPERDAYLARLPGR